ncbi:MAG: tetratricopeptide repeat protein [Candidatus Omnitrophota bacterium]
MSNIYLVGFMGTGKTSVGKELARKKKWHFVDLDDLIELREKRAIADIFAKDGESYFRKLEIRVLKDVSREKNFVVSCGGGIVMEKENIAAMKASGKIICLQATPAIILKRTCQHAHRPLLNVPRPKERIELLLKLRAPYYALADKAIDTSKLSVGQVVSRIIKATTAKPKANFSRAVVCAALGLFLCASSSWAELSKEEAFEEGNQYYRSKMYEQAIAAYTKAISINLEFANLYYNRGLAYYKKGDPYKAISDFDKAITIDPDYAAAYSNRGFIYYKLGDLQQAMADFGRAIKKDPEYARAYYNRGLANYKKNDLAQAILDYSAAIEKSPDNPSFYYNRAVAYYNQGGFDKSITDSLKSLELNPKNSLAYMNLGNIYFKKGLFEMAINEYNLALKISPDSIEVLINRGIAYLEKESVSRALADYNKVIEINPQCGLAYYCRSYGYFLKKDYAKAWVDLRKAQELKYEVAPEFLEALKKESGERD